MHLKHIIYYYYNIFMRTIDFFFLQQMCSIRAHIKNPNVKK